MGFIEKYNSFTDEDLMLRLDERGFYHVLLNSIPTSFFTIGILQKGESQLERHLSKNASPLQFIWSVELEEKGLEVYVENQRMAYIDKDIARIENIELLFHLEEKWLVIYNTLTKQPKARVDWKRNYNQVDLYMTAGEPPGVKVYYHEPMPFWHHDSMSDDDIPVGEKRSRESVY